MGQNEKYNVWLCKWEGGAYYTRAIRVDRVWDTLIMQLRMRSAYDSRCKQTTGISSRQAKWNWTIGN